MSDKAMVTIVTGGSAGIGLKICEDIAATGQIVISLARRAPQIDNKNFLFREVDLADRQACGEVAAELVQQYPITRIVHNAGIIRPALLEDATLDDLDYLSQLHLGSMMQLTQAALPYMKEVGFGRIIGISSRGALGMTTRSNYAATKSGMFGLLRSWSLELAPFGITANCVAPGPIETDMFYEIATGGEEQKKQIESGIPMQRLGQAADVSHAVNLFLSEQAGFITGQVLYVCGGTSIGSLKI